MHEKFTTELPVAVMSPQYIPEFFRLPRTGERDAFFGNTRSQYYAMEKAGQIKLVKLRPKGKKRGTVFVPYAAVAKRLREAQQNGGDT